MLARSATERPVCQSCKPWAIRRCIQGTRRCRCTRPMPLGCSLPASVPTRSRSLCGSPSSTTAHSRAGARRAVRRWPSTVSWLPASISGCGRSLHGPGGFRFAPEETPDAVEYAVVMRRFEEAHSLLGAIRAGSLTRSHIQQVAECLADFHQRSPALAADGPEQLLDSWRVNMQEIERLPFPGSLAGGDDARVRRDVRGCSCP